MIAYCDILISEGATTSAEAAVLGKPVIYAKIFGLGYIDEYDQKYGLIRQATTYREVIQILNEFIGTSGLRERCRKKRNEIIKDKVDVTQWMLEKLKQFLPYSKPLDPTPYRIYQIAKVDPKYAKAGGIEQYVGTISYQLIENDFHVKIIGVEELPHNASAGISECLRQKAKMVQPFACRSFFSVCKNYKSDFCSNIKFLSYLSLKMPFHSLPMKSILHFHRPDYVLPFLFRKNLKICTIHGNPNELISLTKGPVLRVIYRLLEYVSIRVFHRILFVSHSAMVHYQKRFPNLSCRMQVMPLPVAPFFRRAEEQEINAWRKNQGWSPNDKILLYVGRLEKEKKVEQIIRAFHSRFAKDPSMVSVFLVIIGEGSLKSDLQQLVDSLPNPNVRILGFFSNSLLPLVFSSVNATILFSVSEGLPNVALESLACGTPVVSNRVGDMPILIKDGVNGLLIDNINRFDRVLDFLKKSDRITDDCIQSVIPYEINNVIRQLIHVYDWCACHT